ncbi:MAG TPA: hypothetical protein VGQ15_04820 [Gaiellaceae bacterium]|nr:hypothetical protein [Gaiellaceae bacterium]
MLVAVAYFGVIVIAATLGGLWPGIVVFILATAAVAGWVLFTGRRERPPQVAPPGRHSVDERRILVLANETVGGLRLREVIREKASGYPSSRVHVVAPALNSPVRHWASDEDPARRAAEERLQASLARLREGGIDASGGVGDSEPLQALEDGLRLFDADEIVISTHPEGRSHWLEKGVVQQARVRFAVPITHVVVDLEAEREEVR